MNSSLIWSLIWSFDIRLLVIAGLGASLCVGGAGCMEVTSEAKDVCITRTGVEFSVEDVPSGTMGAKVGRRDVPGPSIEKLVVFDDFEDIEYLIDISRDSQLTFKSIELQAIGASRSTVEGLPDVDGLQVSVMSPQALYLPEVELLSCPSRACDVEEGAFHGYSESEVDAVPYLKAGGLGFRFVLTLPRPSTPAPRPLTAWRGDVEICMDVTVRSRASL